MFSEFSHLFSNINDPQLLAEIEVVSVIKTFNPDDVLIEVGDYIRSAPLVLKGLIKVVKEDNNGNELLMYYLSPGETCTVSLTCCMIQEKSEIKAVVEEQSVMLMIPIQYMDDWMIKYKDWKNFVMSSYRKRFDELFNTIDSIAFKKLDERLISYLKTKGKAKGTMLLKSTHQDIAYDLNSSREVVSRLLKQLEREGKIVLGRNQIDLCSLLNNK
jgi:CRP/FNR family transcriptional regulator